MQLCWPNLGVWRDAATGAPTAPRRGGPERGSRRCHGRRARGHSLGGLVNLSEIHARSRTPFLSAAALSLYSERRGVTLQRRRLNHRLPVSFAGARRALYEIAVLMRGALHAYLLCFSFFGS